MNRAFIFDMDGVLVDSEREWETGNEKEILNKFFDEEGRKQIGSTTGLGVRALYDKVTALGIPVDFTELSAAYEIDAMKVYDRARLTEGSDQLAEKLVHLGFKLGLVTSSPRSWMNRVVPRLAFRDRLDVIISLGEHSDLRSKPHPDAYIEAFKQLQADPARSIILEDSNYGLAAAKAAGAYVIAFTGNLLPGYKQDAADAYAKSMNEVATLVETFVTR